MSEVSNKLYRSNDAQLAAFMLALTLQIEKPRMLNEHEINAAVDVLMPFFPPWIGRDEARLEIVRQATDAFDYLTRGSFP